ncbi:MAG: hypothetical protein ABWY20_17230, partial [Mycobacterium sp.]
LGPSRHDRPISAQQIALTEVLDVLAELLHLREVVNAVDENLGAGEGGLRGQEVVDGKRNLARAYGPVEPLLVELPGIELGADIRLTCGNIENRYARPRETTREDLRIRQRC